MGTVLSYWPYLLATYLLGKPQRLADRIHVGSGRSEIVKRLVSLANHVTGNERRAFCRALLGMLVGALPFKHSPAVIAMMRELGENTAEIDL